MVLWCGASTGALLVMRLDGRKLHTDEWRCWDDGQKPIADEKGRAAVEAFSQTWKVPFARPLHVIRSEVVVAATKVPVRDPDPDVPLAPTWQAVLPRDNSSGSLGKHSASKRERK